MTTAAASLVRVANTGALSLQSIWALVKGYADELGIKATPHSFRYLKASIQGLSPPATVEAIWQPGEAEYDHFSGLPRQQ